MLVQKQRFLHNILKNYIKHQKYMKIIGVFLLDINLPVKMEEHRDILNAPIRSQETLDAITALKPSTGTEPDGFYQEIL